MVETPERRPRDVLAPETPEWEHFWELRAELEDAGRRVPCSGDDRHTSEDYRERREAADDCGPCPLLDECADAAASTRETFGVWGGQDLTRPAGSKVPPRKSTGAAA